ncbi:MAG: hypothetical protein LLG00_14395 [Planctomycetaceae bacterium]|nr:hypothetical protein [Planctomycetaceae bacterium]
MMQRQVISSLALVALAGAFVWMRSGDGQTTQVGAPSGTPGSAGDHYRPKSVESKHLLRTVQVVGELGYQWGTMVTIRGDVRESDDGKSTRVFFRVRYVNGKKLHQPVDIGLMQIQPFSRGSRIEMEVGKGLELRGYEKGVIMDFPPQAVEEAIKARDPALTYDYVKFGWRFVPWFVYLSARNVPGQHNDVPSTRETSGALGRDKGVGEIKGT